jgi:hypothetical protein
MADGTWDQLRYKELLQTFRLMSTQVTQYNLGITIALVTLLGFSIDRESWGLAALGLVLEGLMFFTIEVHRRASVELLTEAAELERQETGVASATDAMTAVISGRRGEAIAVGQRALLVVVVGHIGFIVFLALVLDWTFVGKGAS